VQRINSSFVLTDRRGGGEEGEGRRDGDREGDRARQRERQRERQRQTESLTISIPRVNEVFYDQMNEFRDLFANCGVQLPVLRHVGDDGVFDFIFLVKGFVFFD
jgi:hypothetical protein